MRPTPGRKRDSGGSRESSKDKSLFLMLLRKNNEEQQVQGFSEPAASYPEKELKASFKEHRLLPLGSGTVVQDRGLGEPLLSLLPPRLSQRLLSLFLTSPIRPSLSLFRLGSGNFSILPVRLPFSQTPRIQRSKLFLK